LDPLDVPVAELVVPTLSVVPLQLIVQTMPSYVAADFWRDKRAFCHDSNIYSPIADFIPKVGAQWGRLTELNSLMGRALRIKAYKA
jgi:hypothetical protein